MESLKISRSYPAKVVRGLAILIILIGLGGGGVLIYRNFFAPELPAHCRDGLYNQGEEGLDCGWSCPNKCKFTKKSGVLLADEVWSGNILVEDVVEVKEGATLTIEPGAVIKFKHDRDYKTFNRAGLTVFNGTVKAVGTSEKMIWFTSAARDPINGDWWGISVTRSDDSEFKYVIVEFGEMGIEQFDSTVPVSHSIIRWNNAEGLYAERSKPLFEYNLLYGNGYHDIALEQYNEDVRIVNNLFGGGNSAIHHEETTSRIEGNYFKDYKGEVITAGMESRVTIRRNKFASKELFSTMSFSGNCTVVVKDNDYGSGKVPIPKLDYQDARNFAIDYVPGDEADKFPYIYAAEDETRKVLKKLGKGLGFGWALVWANDYLWRFSLGGGEVGDSPDFIRIDPKTGKIKLFRSTGLLNPRGLAWDGEYFWVNDFSLLKIFKFKLAGNSIKIVDSFDIPEKEKGGTSGLTTDGEFLYLRARDGGNVYKLNKRGGLVGTFQMGGGTLVWTGEYFWVAGGCEKGICKFTKDGKLVGEIYPPAKDTWALAWDGKYLWTIQRTCEMWDDPKIYQIEILDDAFEPDGFEN